MRRRPVRGSFSMASGINRHMALRLVSAMRAASETVLALPCRYRLAASNVRIRSLLWLALRSRERLERCSFDLDLDDDLAFFRGLDCLLDDFRELIQSS